MFLNWQLRHSKKQVLPKVFIESYKERNTLKSSMYYCSSFAKQVGIEFSAKGNQKLLSFAQAVYFSYSFYTRPNMKGLKGRLIWLAEHLENWIERDREKKKLSKRKSGCSLFKNIVLIEDAKLSRDNEK